MRKNAIVILIHGSYDEQTRAELATVVERVRERSACALVWGAFLQCDADGLLHAVAAASAAGADSVTVVPLFLFSGFHMKETVPQQLAAAQAAFPQLPLTLAQHIGADAALTDIVLQRAAGASPRGEKNI